MVVYATVAGLAEFLVGVPVWPGAKRHLEQASEDVDELLTGAVYAVDANEMPTDPKAAEAIKRATCAQAHYIREGGDETGGRASITSVGVGSINYSRNQMISQAKQRRPAKYGDRALTILKSERLLPINARTY
ncbi:hypothetical protein ACFOY4_01500 [Actinomadura syzygii]|uniref:Uncharacterized protein n=1 Tax=Actinomadura syzygii TaxID=1427538 RepID=A0A5D0TR18_9ACTN|nr:hypothetical protein [Actinomadura syzygii]TYC08578.1 hypothetical protein FXF65_37425 [Actinomadura syzygii]